MPDPAAAALRVIVTARSADAVTSATSMLDGRDPRLREAILARYAQLAENPTRRDPGCYVRSALLRSLGPVAQREDLPLLERAAAT